MAWDPKFKKGVDGPIWEWLAQFPPGGSYHGSAQAYDGVRYIYWAIQYGSTGAVSTTQLYRYDTWLDGWQYLAALTNSYTGLDVEFDATRNLVYITNGNGATSWQVFNVGLVNQTIANQVIAPWTLATVTLVLPAAANTSASLTMPDDSYVHATGANPTAIDTGTVAAGSTATSIIDSTVPSSFGPGIVGLQVRFLTGALAGQARIVSAAPFANTLTTAAFTAPPAVGDTFVVEVPQNTAAAGSTASTLNGEATAAWATNLYANSDVLIVSGTGIGQRRRIASNTANVLTLAAAVTGNPRTGNWTTTPDATSVYRIVPSSDFLYYTPANGSAAIWRLDVVATTGTAWVALTAAPATLSGGSNSMYPQAYSPFQLIVARGSGTTTFYTYNIGPNTWTTLTTYWGPNENINTGASVCMIHGRRRVWCSLAGSTRVAILDLTTGIAEPGPLEPYANPGGYDGHRARNVKTIDGVEYLYQIRAGGQELWRIALEWMV